MPKMTWDALHGRRLLQGQIWRRRRRLFASPLSGTTELQYAGFTYVGLPLAAGTTTTSGVEAYNAADAKLATSPRCRLHDHGAATTGLVRLLVAARRCTLIATCTTLADTPTLEWEPVRRSRRVRSHPRQRRRVHQRDQTYKTSSPTLTPRESLPRPAGGPGDLLVRQAVRRLQPDALRPERPDELRTTTPRRSARTRRRSSS